MRIRNPGSGRLHSRAGLPMSEECEPLRTERRAISACSADQAGVIKAGSSAPDLCWTTFTPLAWTIGCAYWISGMT